MFSRRVWVLVVSVLVACSLAGPSWAWRGGWRGPRIGLSLGSWPGWYEPYYNDYDYPPYAYYPPYYAPYVLERAAPPQNAQAAPDNSHHDLRFLKRQIDIARGQIDFALEDGDVTPAQHDAEMRRLDDIEKQAHEQARANGGTILGDQEKVLMRQIADGERAEPPPRQERILHQDSEDNMRKVRDRIANLRGLLDKKRAGGDITNAQQNGMAAYLDRIEKQARSDGSANGGDITRDQESTILEQLQRAEDSISRNLIVN